MGKLQMYVTKKTGRNKYTFVVGGDTFHQVVMESRKLSFGDIDKCGICGSDNLVLGAHDTPDEGHEYTYVKCLGCKGQLIFGQQKKEKDVFYFRTKEENNKHVLDWQKFEPKDK